MAVLRAAVTESDDIDTAREAGIEGTPSITCSRCDREWSLAYELDELRVGNQALERFALDHHRHTGHYPDDVTPWVVDCERCPDGDVFLSERPARSWAETHARHTRHRVIIESPDSSEASTVRPVDVE